jgi:pimeloyl-ACP methyl ester carboxylesterase
MERLPAPPIPPWLSAMLPFERYVLAVGGHRLHLMERPGAGRPVLLLHGNPTWGFLWRKVAAELADTDLRLVMPDLLGLGLSDRVPDSFHTIENHATAIGSLVEALDLRGLVLVVQDWGGPIGLRALADRRDRLAGMVVLNTVVGPPGEGFRPTSFHRFARRPIRSFVAFRLLGFPQRRLDLAQGDRSSIRGEVARAYRWPLRGLARNAAPLALARMVPDSLEHAAIPALKTCQELAESFTGPTAIVWGDRDPVLGRARERVASMLPRAPVTRTHAGHFLQEEVPREIAAAIKSVVARI